MTHIHLRSEQSDGHLAVTEMEFEPRFAGPPLHVHRSFDEAFYVLDGELTIRVNDELLTCPAGTLAFAPCGTPHTLANLTGRVARFLVLHTPGGFERWFDQRAGEGEAAGPPPDTFTVGPQIGQ
jgi:quercetin dioxygenase-like cupin family protein